jgi:hypothetical protein
MHHYHMDDITTCIYVLCCNAFRYVEFGHSCDKILKDTEFESNISMLDAAKNQDLGVQ